MSEDQRVSRDSHEPAKSDASGAERWVDCLDWVREDIIRVVSSVSTRPRTSPTPTTPLLPTTDQRATSTAPTPGASVSYDVTVRGTARGMGSVSVYRADAEDADDDELPAR